MWKKYIYGVRTCDDVPYDPKQAAVERDEVEDELDGGADPLGWVVGHVKELLDELGERHDQVAWRRADGGLVARDTQQEQRHDAQQQQQHDAHQQQQHD